MSEPAVDPQDISNLTRRLAEAAHAAMVVRTKLEIADGPLAVLAALRIQAIESAIEAALEAAHRAAELALSVGSEPDPS